MNAAVHPEEYGAATFGEQDERELRKRLKAELPEDTFQARSWRAIWFLPLQLLIWGGIATILFAGLPWYANLGLALVVGHSIGSQGFLAHEVLHGALGMSRRVQNVFGWLGFGPMLVTPEFWRKWHNSVHHAHTNQGDEDPDSFGTMRRYKADPKQKRFVKLAPGGRTWYSYLFLTYSFTFHAQLVLWIQAKKRKHFKGFNRRKAIAQVLVIAGLYAALAIYSGPLALFTVVIPFMVANAMVQGYILTNHFLRPQTETNNPLDNSMSVKTLPILDRLHFRFSHHVEHHFFPKMPSNKMPRVRSWLQENYPERYVCPSHWEAVRLLYSTPRVYKTATTLVDPNDPDKTFDLLPLQRKMSAASEAA
ncbi:fatty acid desaturase [Tamilnaduibacter salinus]|uniref:Fatty acid desaturase n=1 Tax=Tamilnaduibacter salinus TaxID=1484056 RepID=A0A2A2I677_9GAMM|nr:acyl-CoA desaturase [Tamilnaduibacter salinus]PAV27157.1 fatty acid desaturase [Tamilnaduibacter salinus]PVY79011.1 fatty acid desaturase [Tamilnaduibacter salinus]